MRDEFNKLWSLLPRPHGSVVRLFARNGEHRWGDYARTPAEMRKFARQHEGDNCYIAPNPTYSTKGMRHSAEDVVWWSYLLIDIDPVGTHPAPMAAMTVALDLLSHWTDIDVREPLLIDSGRGVQAWIRLEDIELDERYGHGRLVDAADAGGGSTTIVSRSTARRTNGWWLKRLDEVMLEQYGCRVDTSTSDLPRVMRLPGTVNVKTGRPTSILNANGERYHGLAEKLIVGVPEKLFVDEPLPPGLAKGLPWQKVFTHLTVAAQNYLLYGQAEPGRHKAVWLTAKSLSEKGVTLHEARKAIRRANKKQGADEELPPEQLETVLKGAFGEQYNVV
jgi:hypothetical protein